MPSGRLPVMPGNPRSTRKYLLPTERVTTLDIAWAAGVYEGEGWIGGRSIAVTISQKDRWLLDRLRALFGGHICSYPDKRDSTRTYHIWQVGGALASGFIQTIYKFLSPRRRKQALIAILKDELRLSKQLEDRE